MMSSNKVVRIPPRKVPQMPPVQDDVDFADRMLGAALAGISAVFVVVMLYWIIKHYHGG